MQTADFQAKELDLRSKIDEVWKIMNHYVPSVSESVSELYDLLERCSSCWFEVLASEQKGENVHPTNPNYLQTMIYSNLISSKVVRIRQEIRKEFHHCFSNT